MHNHNDRHPTQATPNNPLNMRAAAPVHIQTKTLTSRLCQIDGIKSIHDLHIWTLSSGKISLSVHEAIPYFADWAIC